MAKTYDPDNERVKRSYRSYQRDAQQMSEASLDAIAGAIHRFEAYSKFRPFKQFHREQAIGFKAHLAQPRRELGGKPLSLATQYAILAALKTFFRWLAREPGFRKRLRYSDADYFSMPRAAVRIAKTPSEARVPSLEQMRHVISLMPSVTAIERRDRALVAVILATGARDGTIPWLKRKHLDIAGQRIVFDAREVRTKYAKSFSSSFCQVGDDILAIIEEWATYLDKEALWGPDDPLFPATRIKSTADKGFQAAGLDRKHWRTAGPVLKVFREAFARAGFPYCSPHSVRKTLVRFGQQHCHTAEDYKAWSQNLGHEDVLTTFTSYGRVSPDRQAEIIRTLGRPKADEDDPIDELRRAVDRYASRNSPRA